MKLTFENPWTLVAHVKEKGKSGYVPFNDTNLYFDRKGTALFESKKTFTGVPYDGKVLSFDASKVEIGKKIPVEDESAFTLNRRGFKVSGEIFILHRIILVYAR